MKPTETTLLALLAASLLLAGALPAAAGTAEDPEMGDGVDDVDVNGVCSGGFGSVPPCPSMDFLWPNVDISAGYVGENETHLVFSILLKSESGLKGQKGFTFDYAVAFQVGNASFTASAHMDDAGAFTPGGNATAAASTANTLALTVPKAAVGAFRGDRLTGLYATAHGASAAGDFVLDDRAPDANAGRDYPVQSGAVRMGYHTLGAAPASATLANATRIDTYNWTATGTGATFDLRITATNGTAQVTVLDGAGAPLLAASATTTKALTGKAGTWSVRVALENFSGSYTLGLQPRAAPTCGANATTTASCTTGPNTTATTSTTQAAPALGVSSLALAIAVLAARKGERRFS